MTSQYNPSKIRSAPGDLFLLPVPTSGGLPVNPAAAPGSGAAATAVLTSQAVTSITGLTGGTNYDTAPLVSFTGGGGTGATGHAIVVAGVVTQVVIDTPGSGYVSAPTVVFTPQPSNVPSKILTGYFGLFYQDGNKKAVLNSNVLPWSVLKSDGLKADIKFKSMMAEVNNASLPINGGQYAESLGGEVTILDFSRDKLVDIISATAGQLNTIAQGAGGSGQAGKKGVMIGSQVIPAHYVLMYRSPSPGFPGAYDHWLLPRVTIDPQATPEFAKTKLIELKVKLMGESDLFLMDPDTGNAVAAYYEETTTLVP